jgi:hypothetical protein
MGCSRRSWPSRRRGRRQLLIFDNGADGSVRSDWAWLGTNWGRVVGRRGGGIGDNCSSSTTGLMGL